MMGLPTAAEQFMPHSAPMALIDTVISCALEAIVAEVRISPETMFCRDGVVPAWVGIEYMAQTAAAWSGYNARVKDEANDEPAIGYLLGTRDYSVHCDGFMLGDKLKISAECLLQSVDGLGSFDCKIERNGVLIATARLSVFQPAAGHSMA
ncbi:MAG: 3-hydroxylacyl-ACP dehydratase [Formosimonas sp.]|jgi:predicted hotdog family 3-hydroxylacyl-ACP dehydratase